MKASSATSTAPIRNGKGRKRSFCGLLVSFLLLAACAPFGSASNPDETGRTTPKASAARLSRVKADERLSGMKIQRWFEPNIGQAGAGTAFISRGSGTSMSLTENPGFSVALTASDSRGNEQPLHEVRIDLINANAVRPTPQKKLPGLTNYLVGSDPVGWVQGAPTYSAVQYDSVYPGIDMAFYSKEKAIEYDFMVAPKADPARIKMKVSGSSRLRLDRKGNLVISAGVRNLVQKRPVIYQRAGGVRKYIHGSFRIIGDEVGFSIGRYDRSLPLVIDPVVYSEAQIDYSTYLGQGVPQVGVDKAGAIYVAEQFGPTTVFPPSGPPGDIVITKLGPEGAHVWSSFLGGTDGKDVATDLVGGDGMVYLSGTTTSTNFPRTVGRPYQGRGDNFVTALSAQSGTTAGGFSRYLGGSAPEGGSDEASYFDSGDGGGLAVDWQGNAYLADTTQSVYSAGGTSVETKGNAFQPSSPEGAESMAAGRPLDGYVTRLDAQGEILAATFLGSSHPEHARCRPLAKRCPGDDFIAGIGVDDNGNAFVSGVTYSDNFPVTTGPSSPERDFSGKGFVVKLSPDLTNLMYATYLSAAPSGSPPRWSYYATQPPEITVDASGWASIFGNTEVQDLATKNAYRASYAGPSSGSPPWDYFLTTLDSQGQTRYSTYFGGSTSDYQGLGSPNDIAVDCAGHVFVNGQSTSTDFPKKNWPRFTPPFDSGSGRWNWQAHAVVAKFDPRKAGEDSLMYSGFIGGLMEDGRVGGTQSRRIAVDSDGSAYAAGYTEATTGHSDPAMDFPVTENAVRKQHPGTGISPANFLTKVKTEGEKLTPVLDGIAPSSGPVGRKTEVTVSGRCLDNATEVTFAGIPISESDIKLRTPGRVVFLTPALSMPQTVSVTVTTPRGTTNPMDFTFTPVMAEPTPPPPGGDEEGGAGDDGGGGQSDGGGGAVSSVDQATPPVTGPANSQTAMGAAPGGNAPPPPPSAPATISAPVSVPGSAPVSLPAQVANPVSMGSPGSAVQSSAWTAPGSSSAQGSALAAIPEGVLEPAPNYNMVGASPGREISAYGAASALVLACTLIMVTRRKNASYLDLAEQKVRAAVQIA